MTSGMAIWRRSQRLTRSSIWVAFTLLLEGNLAAADGKLGRSRGPRKARERPKMRRVGLRSAVRIGLAFHLARGRRHGGRGVLGLAASAPRPTTRLELVAVPWQGEACNGAPRRGKAGSA